MNVNALCPTCGLPQAEHRGLGCVPLLMDYIKQLEDCVQVFAGAWDPALNPTVDANMARGYEFGIETSRNGHRSFKIQFADLRYAAALSGRRLTDPERQQRELKRV